MKIEGVSDLKGPSDIKGLRSLHTRPGPITESSKLLRLYQLSVEKDSITKKLERIKQQKVQTENRLAEITSAIHNSIHLLEEATKRQANFHSAANVRRTYIEY